MNSQTADSRRYPVGTLNDIAAIPKDALPRFLAELPAILTALEDVKAAAPALAAEMKANAPRLIRWLPVAFFEEGLLRQVGKQSVWIDDDKGDVTLTMRVSKTSDDPFFSRTEKMGEPA